MCKGRVNLSKKIYLFLIQTVEILSYYVYLSFYSFLIMDNVVSEIKFDDESFIIFFIYKTTQYSNIRLLFFRILNGTLSEGP